MKEKKMRRGELTKKREKKQNIEKRKKEKKV